MSNDKTPTQEVDGPYTTRRDKGRYVLDGPTPTTGFWALEEWDAQNHADDLNAAYRAGAEWQASQAPSQLLTVEQIMEVVKYNTTPYILEKTWPNELPELWQRIHDRLTDLLDQTSSPR
mgnify:FL=1